MKRRIFKDDKLDKDFDEKGYVIVDLLTDDECRSLLNQYQKLDAGVDEQHKFYSTYWSENPEYRKTIDKIVRGFLNEKLNKFVERYRALVGIFLSKRVGDNSDCNPHQDWNYVDESQFTSLTVWCPITDMSPNAGTLAVFEGSHKLKNLVRGRSFYHYIGKVRPVIRKRFLQPLTVKKGQAVIMNARLIHGSENNTTPVERVAAAIISIPQEATGIHYVADPVETDMVHMINAEDDFYVNHTCFDMVDTTRNSMKKFPLPENYLGVLDLYLLRWGIVPKS